ncbi:MAG TPA: DEAD/DEAH box helicase [Thermoleophilaceae bacterium]|nr:DEAD/DEAH box helicase [Thermoleophilaceae bacterium]
MSGFPIPPSAAPAAESPEALYAGLRVSDPDLSSLWSQQADALRLYHDAYTDDPDVAIEMPTGAGKTLVGLLIAEWRRRRYHGRVAYLCPTRQLASQAAAKAHGYGIRASLLVGPNPGWDPADKLAFQNGSAIAISTYSSVFNSASRLEGCSTLVFDDAHAAEEPVARAWTVDARRSGDALYYALLAPLRRFLPESFGAAMEDDTLNPARRTEVEIVLPAGVADAAPVLADAIAAHTSRENERQSYFAAQLIGGRLGACVAYVSWERLQLRPLIAPTFGLDAFSDPAQRVYMSATLGAAGELERAFGVAPIERVPAQPGWARHGSGRRFIVVADAQGSAEDTDALVSDAISATPRAIAIAPSRRRIEQFAARCIPDGYARVGHDAIEQFKSADKSVLTIANRYDGIDMPNDACRLVVLDGVPAQTHLQERFVATKLGARRVLSERIRTRLVQGMGRCTRNRHDYAAVILCGEDMLEFITRADEISALRPDLQAEVRLALDYAEDNDLDIEDLVRKFLSRSDDWEPVEDYLQQQADELEQRLPVGSDALQDAARFEVQACEAAWRGDVSEAVEFAQRALGILDAGGRALSPWRALWLSLAADWSRQCAPSIDGDEALTHSLQEAARAAASGTSWLPSFPDAPATGAPAEKLERRARIAASNLRRLGIRGRRFEDKVSAISNRLAGTHATEYELGLLELGTLLGFDAARPNAEADPDVAWRDGTDIWIVFEAKTEESEEGPLSVSDVRQAETHLRWVERELAWETPERAILAIVCPKTTIHDAAKTIAGEQRLVHPDAVREIASRAIAVARAVHAAARPMSDEELADEFATGFTEARLTNDALAEALSRRSVRDG